MAAMTLRNGQLSHQRTWNKIRPALLSLVTHRGNVPNTLADKLATWKATSQDWPDGCATPQDLSCWRPLSYHLINRQPIGYKGSLISVPFNLVHPLLT